MDIFTFQRVADTLLFTGR